MLKNRMGSLAVAGSLLFVLGCGSPDGGTPGAATGEMPANHPTLGADGAVVGAPAGVQYATVMETMDSGGYTYALLNLAGEEAWVAGPQTAMAVGDEVAVSGASPMENFTSSSLDRTFDVIYFVGAFNKPGDAPPAPVGQVGTVIEAFPSAGYTYLNLKTADGDIWMAAPAMSVEVGDEVVWQGGMPMQNFTSSSLGRTFESILFVDEATVR